MTDAAVMMVAALTVGLIVGLFAAWARSASQGQAGRAGTYQAGYEDGAAGRTALEPLAGWERAHEDAWTDEFGRVAGYDLPEVGFAPPRYDRAAHDRQIDRQMLEAMAPLPGSDPAATRWDSDEPEERLPSVQETRAAAEFAVWETELAGLIEGCQSLVDGFDRIEVP